MSGCAHISQHAPGKYRHSLKVARKYLLHFIQKFEGCPELTCLRSMVRPLKLNPGRGCQPLAWVSESEVAGMLG